MRAALERVADFVERHPDVPVGAVARMLAGSRTVFEHRAALTTTGTDRDTLVERLRTTDQALRGAGRPADDPVWVFPGQGAQWPGMAVKLLDENGAFAEQLAQCARALEPFVDWDLLAVLRGEPGQPDFDRVDVVQPALWAVMVSLAAQWRAVGVHPAAVIGHSQGEIAAATAAGALSLSDGARVVALRSRLIAQHAGDGGMTSLALPRTQAEEAAARFGLEVAAVNSPDNTVLAGPVEALDRLTAWCDEHDIRCRRVPVDYASHSSFVDVMRDQLLDALAPIAPRDTDTPLYSSLTANLIHGSDLDADYWYRNLRHTVAFEAATRAAA
ncbi:acyltransferase domain-containing protein, partial [Streptomyces sp. bgisy154]|uniref:acyltransferase domain-containing protein n=1 Tax=Streptomyces sp. bgisy154 TaxID=3413794 RepID=UPI003D7105D9